VLLGRTGSRTRSHSCSLTIVRSSTSTRLSVSTGVRSLSLVIALPLASGVLRAVVALSTKAKNDCLPGLLRCSIFAACAGAAAASKLAAATAKVLPSINSAGDLRHALGHDLARGADRQLLDVRALGGRDRGRAGLRRAHVQQRDALAVGPCAHG